MCGGWHAYGRERGIHVLDRSSVASTLVKKAGVKAYQTPGKCMYILCHENVTCALTCSVDIHNVALVVTCSSEGLGKLNWLCGIRGRVIAWLSSLFAKFLFMLVAL